MPKKIRNFLLFLLIILILPFLIILPDLFHTGCGFTVACEPADSAFDRTFHIMGSNEEEEAKLFLENKLALKDFPSTLEKYREPLTTFHLVDPETGKEIGAPQPQPMTPYVLKCPSFRDTSEEYIYTCAFPTFPYYWFHTYLFDLGWNLKFTVGNDRIIRHVTLRRALIRDYHTVFEISQL